MSALAPFVAIHEHAKTEAKASPVDPAIAAVVKLRDKLESHALGLVPMNPQRAEELATVQALDYLLAKVKLNG